MYCGNHDGQLPASVVPAIRLGIDRRMPIATTIDTSQTPRQDYFLNFQFHVRAGMPPGLYTLVITVKDEGPPGTAGAGADAPASPRQARASLDFRVCPPDTRPSPGH